MTIQGSHYLRFIIPGCQAWSKNAWRDLITHYFKTPVERVAFFRHTKKNQMVIDVEFKSSIVMPKISHTNFFGYYLLLLHWEPRKK